MAEKDEKAAVAPPEVDSTTTSDSTLPAVRCKIPNRVWLVQALYFLERAAFYGASQPFQNYLQLQPDDPLRPGALGLGQSKAVLIIYVWFIYSYSTPLIGGLIADCWLGRRRTIQIGFIIYILGLGLITATAFTHKHYGKGGLPGFIVGLLLVGAGTGTVKPNVTVFIIDQLPEEEPQVVKLKNGESAVTSRELTIQFIYNVNYWFINVGGMMGIITTITELHAGFGYAYLISLGFIIASAAVFNIGFPHFVRAPPAGNVLTSVYGALRSRQNRSSNQTAEVTELSAEPEAVVEPTGDELVLAETKTALKACLVFLPFPALMLSINIMDSGLVAQAGSMQTHGLPNDIMYNLNPISAIILLPIFQSFIYPALAKRKIRFSAEQRIAVGLFFAALAMGYATGIQNLIYKTGPCFDHPLKCLPGSVPNNVNVGLQTPTYVLLAIGEILAIVAGTELAYTRAPANMKSIVQSLFQFFSAVGALLGVFVSFGAEDPNMVIVYGSITGLLLFATGAFEIAVARKCFG